MTIAHHDLVIKCLKDDLDTRGGSGVPSLECDHRDLDYLVFKCLKDDLDTRGGSGVPSLECDHRDLVIIW